MVELEQDALSKTEKGCSVPGLFAGQKPGMGLLNAKVHVLNTHGRNQLLAGQVQLFSSPS
jgi:hypothetical protein